MKIQTFILYLSIQIIFANLSVAQDAGVTSRPSEIPILFRSEQPLSIKLKYSIKDIKKNTTDSTYMVSTLFYKNEALVYDSLAVKIRARGNFRRKYCYYAPIKLKLKESLSKGTPFQGNKKLKVVLPCSIGTIQNDNVVKEYMAYKFYEIISPVHFKTRLANIEFIEEKGQRTKVHSIKGVFVEDLGNVAERVDGREITRRIEPLQHDAVTSVNNSFFHYLIGNTDFSTRSLHNNKLLFIDKKIICIPYDFDMSGLVDADYATISGVDNLPNNITEVTQRLYKGYKRDGSIFQKVRQDFLGHKIEILDMVDNLKEFFQNPDQFKKAKLYVVDFFEILESDKSFDKYILSRARTN